MVAHHIFLNAVTQVLKLGRRLAGAHDILYIFFRNRYIMFLELLHQFIGKRRAPGNLCQRLHIKIIRIARNILTALSEGRLNFIDNGNNSLYVRISRMISLFLELGKVFLGHNIRHYRHIVFLRGNINLPCILHNVFCGLSLTIISSVIHNCTRNV